MVQQGSPNWPLPDLDCVVDGARRVELESVLPVDRTDVARERFARFYLHRQVGRPLSRRVFPRAAIRVESLAV